jgi:hypothetical protein
MSNDGADTGWQKPNLVQTPEGDKGQIALASGLEKQPCMLCKSFEKDVRRLRQHLAAQGLTPDKNGFYETPIAKEIAGRRSLKIKPRDYGWCRRNGGVVHMNATCPDFVITQTRADLAGKLINR